MRNFSLEKMQSTDWCAVNRVYLEGIATGNATFETDAPDWQTWNASHLGFGRLVAHNDGLVVGWAALSPISNRCIYGGVAEISVYVGAEHRGHGIGRSLLSALIQESEQNGIWTLQAGTFPENKASLALHQNCGFRKVGVRERIGKLNGMWRDVVLLERRSTTIGID